MMSVKPTVRRRPPFQQQARFLRGILPIKVRQDLLDHRVSSMQAMIRSAPLQAGQVSMSMPNTRFRLCAQDMAGRRYAGVFSCSSSDTNLRKYWFVYTILFLDDFGYRRP